MSSVYPSETKKYRQLLVVLIVLFLLSPFLELGIGGIVSDLLLLYTIVLVIRSFALPRGLLFIYIAIAGSSFFMQVSINLGWSLPFNQAFEVLSKIVFVLYIGGAAYLIGRDIIAVPRITADTVKGGVSVYLLIGFAWAFLYSMVATVDPDAFSQPLMMKDAYLKTFHFSFTTLTTLGYGDIVPVSEVALVLTNLEAIIGQLYPAVFISVLVGGYLAHRTYP